MYFQITFASLKILKLKTRNQTMKVFMKLITFIFLASTLTGCASKYWYNSRTGADYNSDNYQCELASRQNTLPQQNNGLIEGMRYSGEKADLYNSCMYARGWYLSDKK